MKGWHVCLVCATAIIITIIVQASKLAALFILLHSGGVVAPQ